MDTAKLNPWNWFRKEENNESLTPALRASRKPGIDLYGSPLFAAMENLMDSMFKDSMFRFDPLAGRTAHRSMETVLKPNLDISSDEKEYRITVELPGVDESDVRVEIEDNSLRISGEKRIEEEDKSKGYYRVERTYGTFQRVLTLPKDVDADAVKAAHKKGVLTITLPRKALAPSENRRIAIDRE